MAYVELIRADERKDITVTRSPVAAPVALLPSGRSAHVEVITPEGRSVRDVIVAVAQPTTPDTAQPVDIGLVEISQFVGQQGRQGPAGPKGDTGPVGPQGAKGDTGATGVAATVIADNAPTTPIIGQLWWESDLGNLLIWYDDGSSQQWVAANSPGPVGPQGPKGDVGPMGPPGSGEGSLAVTFIGPDPPVAPVPGSLWWESDSGQMFVWYEDINSSQWVPTSIGAPGEGVVAMTERLNMLEARLAALEGTAP